MKKRFHLIMGPVSLASGADAILALGHQPILGWDEIESAEITAASDGLLLNLAMPSPERVEAMLKSQQAARQKGIPVVFDPVGVGASDFRLQTAEKIVAAGVDLIKGNASEILQLASGERLVPGVDSCHETDEVLDAARDLVDRTGAMVFISGYQDELLWSDGRHRLPVQKLDHVWSGTGCVLGAVLTLAMTYNNPVETVRHFALQYRELLAQATDREDLTRLLQAKRGTFSE